MLCTFTARVGDLGAALSKVALRRSIDYGRRMLCKNMIVLAFGATAAVGIVSCAHAGEKLPGVSEDHRIVRPLPEPVDDAPDSDTIKVGDWDVRISGSVTIDIGTGNLPPPR